jgi:hypothetical protein
MIDWSSKGRWRAWLKRNPTFEATLVRRGKRKIKKILRRIKIEGFAMTELECSECKHPVWLEAHHQYGSGKPRKIDPLRFKSKKEFEEYKKWRTKMLRTPLKCPSCNCKTFTYVKTTVMDHGTVYSELSD